MDGDFPWARRVVLAGAGHAHVRNETFDFSGRQIRIAQKPSRFGALETSDLLAIADASSAVLDSDWGQFGPPECLNGVAEALDVIDVCNHVLAPQENQPSSSDEAVLLVVGGFGRCRCGDVGFEVGGVEPSEVVGAGGAGEVGGVAGARGERCGRGGEVCRVEPSEVGFGLFPACGEVALVPHAVLSGGRVVRGQQHGLQRPQSFGGLYWVEVVLVVPVTDSSCEDSACGYGRFHSRVSRGVEAGYCRFNARFSAAAARTRVRSFDVIGGFLLGRHELPCRWCRLRASICQGSKVQFWPILWPSRRPRRAKSRTAFGVIPPRRFAACSVVSRSASWTSPSLGVVAALVFMAFAPARLAFSSATPAASTSRVNPGAPWARSCSFPVRMAFATRAAALGVERDHACDECGRGSSLGGDFFAECSHFLSESE